MYGKYIQKRQTDLQVALIVCVCVCVNGNK